MSKAIKLLERFSNDELRAEIARRVAAGKEENKRRIDAIRATLSEGETFQSYYSKKRREKTDARFLQIVQMKKDGRRVVEIARHFDLSANFIYTCLRKHKRMEARRAIGADSPG